ncbi:ribulose-5-phosphate 4-epimerase-like epimerase or aldolase [Synechococcus sp. PCC 7502]|uniref:class II aldolase/adducin family protein n=1 Tax=Synechococcus sp. PCC 7502 TaxID=1173263 RepID=UPI00029F884B|nr:class II aldolase/adducin family protein [Synechococcus sp. PCC 7502]AFY75404.1 ribulose-5-phosphate 4-epimerase-like epimerase or aldolase [Synechococcus sp. PCC 7502]
MTADNLVDDSPKDGVIKYSLEAITASGLKQSSRFKVIDFKELEAWRSQLYDLKLIGQYPDGVGYGNLSMRAEGEGFYITATQTGALPNLEISDYPQVLSYNLSSHSLVIQGSKFPSSEAPTHSAIYALHSEIKAIFHIHSAPLWQKLLEIGYLATSDDIEYGTPEMAIEIGRIYAPIEDIFSHNLFVMAGHEDGIFAFGRNCEQAGSAILRIYNKFLLD